MVDKEEDQISTLSQICLKTASESKSFGIVTQLIFWQLDDQFYKSDIKAYTDLDFLQILYLSLLICFDLGVWQRFNLSTLIPP